MKILIDTDMFALKGQLVCQLCMGQFRSVKDYYFHMDHMCEQNIKWMSDPKNDWGADDH